MTSPAAALHTLSASSTNAIFETSRPAGAYIHYKLGASGSTIGYIGSANQLASGGVVADLTLRAESNLTFATGGSTEHMRLDSAGNLGINTINPSYKLDVNGTARINNLTTVVTQETATYITASTATTTIDLSLGTAFIVTISANTTFAFSNIPAGTNMTSFSIITINDATAGRAVSWPAAVTWTGGTLPPRTTTANKSDAWTFFTNNSGTTIVGSLSVTNF